MSLKMKVNCIGHLYLLSTYSESIFDLSEDTSNLIMQREAGPIRKNNIVLQETGGTD